MRYRPWRRRGSRAVDLHPDASQGVEERLEPVELRLVEGKGIVSCGLSQRDIPIPLLVGARTCHGQKLYGEAPDGTPEDLKHATVERGNAILVDLDFEQVHNAKTYRHSRHLGVASKPGFWSSCVMLRV